jgi:hypothetical protein
MRPQLNHSIVWCRDKVKSAGFLTRVLGLPDPRPFMHFLVVDLSNSVSLTTWKSTRTSMDVGSTSRIPTGTFWR